MIGAIRIALLVAVAIAATVAANFVLIGVATGQQDPVGRLVPQARGGRPVASRHVSARARLSTSIETIANETTSRLAATADSRSAGHDAAVAGRVEGLVAPHRLHGERVAAERDVLRVEPGALVAVLASLRVEPAVLPATRCCRGR